MIGTHTSGRGAAVGKKDKFSPCDETDILQVEEREGHLSLCGSTVRHKTLQKSINKVYCFLLITGSRIFILLTLGQPLCAYIHF